MNKIKKKKKRALTLNILLEILGHKSKEKCVRVCVCVCMCVCVSFCLSVHLLPPPFLYLQGQQDNSRAMMQPSASFAKSDKSE